MSNQILNHVSEDLQSVTSSTLHSALKLGNLSNKSKKEKIHNILDNAVKVLFPRMYINNDLVSKIKSCDDIELIKTQISELNQKKKYFSRIMSTYALEKNGIRAEMHELSSIIKDTKKQYGVETFKEFGGQLPLDLMLLQSSYDDLIRQYDACQYNYNHAKEQAHYYKSVIRDLKSRLGDK